MKIYDFIPILVFLVIYIVGTILAFTNHVWGFSTEGALYYLSSVIGAGLFWIGYNIKKK